MNGKRLIGFRLKHCETFMKTTVSYGIIAFLGTFFLASNYQPRSAKELLQEIQRSEVTTDPDWVRALGADKIGMRRYVMAFLKRGPKRDQSSDEAAEIQRGHMENIARMAKEGKLVVAGPFMDDGDIRGIYIFNVESIDEAKQLTATDTAIQAGRLEMDLHPWYGSAALQLVTPLHQRVAPSQP